MYIVERGKRDDGEEVRIRKLIQEGVTLNDSQIANLLKKRKDSRGYYGGAFYSLYFRVNRPITLHELGFYGPYESENANYMVNVEIFRPKPRNIRTMPNCWDSIQIGNNCSSISAEKNEIFYIKSSVNGAGIFIESGIWHLIQFMLDGPETTRCNSCASLVTVPVEGSSIETENGKRCEVIFEFNKGPFQLPSMKFDLPNSQQIPQKVSTVKQPNVFTRIVTNGNRYIFSKGRSNIQIQ